jgi:prepilin-type processing-associated H-X9-DG protein
MYEDDNGTFPYAFDGNFQEEPPGGFSGNHSYDRRGWWWFNHIIDYSRKYSGKDSILWCPSREINDMRLKDNILCGNYGVNQSICKSTTGRRSRAEFIGTPLSSSNILHPSQSLLIVDSGYSMINWWHVTDVPPEPLGNSIEDAAYVPSLEINREKIWPGLEWDATTSRHPNKTVNTGFADGHVKSTKADDLFVEKTETGYNNQYPLWRPIKNNND